MTINIGKEFSRYPLGRYLADGSSNGQKFREEFLRPAIASGYNPIVIELDDALGYGSSFLEEAFGGLVRTGCSRETLLHTLEFRSEDPGLISEIRGYISSAK